MPPTQEVFRRLMATKLVAVLVVDDVEQAKHVAGALLKGGVDAIELTLRTPAALDAISVVSAQFPELVVGAGTILTTGQVEAALEAGAEFGVAPGLNRSVLQAAIDHGLPFAPGVMTPSEIDVALLEFDCKLMKYFPAESCGGLSHLASMVAPYQHLDPRFLPLGGIDANNLADYVASKWVAAVGGSWLAPRHTILARDWKQITANALEARRMIEACT